MTSIKAFLSKGILPVILGVFLAPGLYAEPIKKNMSISIKILGVPPSEHARINTQYPVDGSGNIRMWEIGEIRAAGLEPTALARKIEKAYVQAQIYTNPTIIIETNMAEGQLTEVITLTGKVGRPGPVQYTAGMTLAQAIAAAGGANTFGTTKRVNVYREGKKYTLSPRTNDKHKLERVYPNDIIEIDQVKAWESGGQ